MKEQIASLRQVALEELGTLNDLKQLEDFRVRYMGKKGSVTALLRGMGALSAEERPIMGQLANEVRDEINKLLDTKMAELKLAAQQAKLASETIDVTLPGRALNHGTKHPVTMVIEEAKQSHKYTLAKYSSVYKERKQKGEVIDEWYRLTLTKVFDDEKEPISSVEVIYDTEGVHFSANYR